MVVEKWEPCMPFGCIRRVRELGINCKYSKCKPKCTIKPKTGVNFDNLIQVEINHKDGSIHDTQVTVCTVNVRSIRNKDQSLLRELNHHNIDIAVVSETWLKDGIDDLWIETSDFNREPYTL